MFTTIQLAANTDNDQTFQSVLFCFPGTYNTVYDPSELFNPALVDDNGNTNGRYFDLADWSEFMDDLGSSYTGFLNSYIKYVLQDRHGIDLQVEEVISFKDTSSPKEYNFSTDRVFVEMHIRFAVFLSNYVDRDRQAFQDYLINKYQSRSGFISHYSDSICDWDTKLDKVCDGELDHNELGSLLEFWLQQEADQDELVWDIFERVSDDCFSWDSYANLTIKDDN